MVLGYPNDTSRLYIIEHGKSRRHDGHQILDLIGCRLDHEQGYISNREILLMLYSVIDGNQDFKLLTDGDSQQLAVLLPGPPHLLDSATVVIPEMPFQCAWQAFVDQNFHRTWAMTNSLACSSAVIAAVCVTDGKSSRNSLSVWPPSR